LADSTHGAIYSQQANTQAGSVLMTNKNWEHYELIFDFWPTWGNDAGVFNRVVATGTTAGRTYQTGLDYKQGSSVGGSYGEGGYGNFNIPIPREPGELRWSAEQHGGALMDLGCYPLHALRTLTGAEPEVVSASAVFENGVDASLTAAAMRNTSRVGADTGKGTRASARLKRESSESAR